MKITHENYEVFMLSYLDGELSGPELVAFEEFLLEHPELKSEAEGVNEITLSTGDGFFEDKELLKARMIKQVIEEEEQTCFDAVEGTLDPDKRMRLDKRMVNSDRLRVKLSKYQEANLQAPVHITFPNKADLHRKDAVIAKERVLWPYLVAAAMVAGVVYFVVPTDKTTSVDSNKTTISEIVKQSKELKPEPKIGNKDSVTNPSPSTEIQEPKASPTNVAALINAPEVKSVDDLIKEAKREVSKDPKETPWQSKKVPMVAESRPIKNKPAQVEEKTPQREVEVAPKSENTLAFNPPKPKPFVSKYNSSTQPANKSGNRPHPVGNPNNNFIAMSDNKRQELMDVDGQNEPILTGILSYVSGGRLTIEEVSATKTKINFESKLVGFTTSISK